MGKEKSTISSYTCEKCNKNVYFRTSDEVITKCKTCGQEMKYNGTYPYNPKRNIKQANQMNSYAHIAISKPNQPTVEQHIPKCPTCQSENIEKISITKKVVGGALFGLFSSDVRKTMHCKNCGYKW